MRSDFIMALAVSAAAVPLDIDDFKFMKYLTGFGKSYQTVEEYAMRKARFLSTDADIDYWNKAQSTAHLAHNFLSDWTDEEYQRLLGLKNQRDLHAEGMEPEVLDPKMNANHINGLGAPTSWNWCTYLSGAYCTPIRD
jgi:hypothetical protein